MIRKIVNIDEDKCTGCGLCANACHENAIVMVDGKAKLLKDDFCDGFGDCLPACPAGAITITEREAVPYDEKAVEDRKKMLESHNEMMHEGGCPGSRLRNINGASSAPLAASKSSFAPVEMKSQLRHWPVQIKLLPCQAPFFDEADILIAADCTSYAYANFHNQFIKGRTVLIGCPKLDSIDYTDKLASIFTENNIRSVTVVRMEVPCCGGISRAASTALEISGKKLPLKIITISIEGEIISEDFNWD